MIFEGEIDIDKFHLVGCQSLENLLKKKGCVRFDGADPEVFGEEITLFIDKNGRMRISYFSPEGGG